MFLVDMNFTRPELITQTLTSAHRAHLASEYACGNLALGGRKFPRTGGVILSQHSDRDALEAMLQTDPFVQTGAADFTITEFEPVMAAQAFQSLLA
jgi:uncharacterized protein YciI